MDNKSITVETIVDAPMEKVWECWNSPEHIRQWAFASDAWEAPRAENDVRTGGRFKIVMAAKDGSESFDFVGIYTQIKEPELIAYDMAEDHSAHEGREGQGGRHVVVKFSPLPEGVHVVETFDLEKVNSEDVQRSGWQAILNNFKKHVESH